MPDSDGDSSVAGELPPTPPTARAVFGDQLPVAEAYVAHLAGSGTVQGLLGPREIPRLWERHVLNSAVIGEVIDPGMSVADIGSGAGLPGLALAIARPDLQVTLIESLLRRSNWLSMVSEDLALSNVTVIRGRAEELVGTVAAEVVTSRAVAPLDRLAKWSLPLLVDNGRMIAVKGSTAEAELAEAKALLHRLGAVASDVLECGVDVLSEPTTVIAVAIGERAVGRANGAAQRTMTTGRARGSARRRRRSQ